MFTIDAADDGTNHASSIQMIDQPNWPIQDFLNLLDSIQNPPPEQQEEAKRQFFETHAGGAVRTIISNQNFPDAPSESKNTFHRDESGRRC